MNKVIYTLVNFQLTSLLGLDRVTIYLNIQKEYVKYTKI